MRIIFFLRFFQIFIYIFLVHDAISADLGIECTVFDVGQGSGAVIRDKQKGVSFIIDAGNSGSEQETAPLLRRFNTAIFGKPGSRHRIAGILLSHSDGDHVKLLARVLNSNSRALKDQNTNPRQRLTAYLGSPFTGYLEGSGKPCLDALIAINAHIKPLSHVMTSEDASRIKSAEDVTMPPRPYFMNALIPEFSDSSRQLRMIIMAANILHEGTAKFLGEENNPGSIDEATSEEDTVFREGTNNNGAVVKLTYKENRIVFPGDIDGDHGTDKLIKNVPSTANTFLNTDILLAAHHGADRGRTNNVAWLLKSDPRHIIISAGERGGDFIHPRFNVLYTMASILGMNDYKVKLHTVQFGDPTGTHTKDCHKLKRLFWLEADGASNIEIKKSNEIEWMLINTYLPLYTTKTSGDIQILLSADGTLAVRGI